jgi:hypothetical protein
MKRNNAKSHENLALLSQEIQLIVDDGKDLLCILQEQLSTWHRVDAFTDSGEAIRRTEGESRNLNYYDVIQAGHSCRRYIVKPFAMSQLHITVNRLFDI